MKSSDEVLLINKLKEGDTDESIKAMEKANYRDIT
jgi:hypothetical protein